MVAALAWAGGSNVFSMRPACSAEGFQEGVRLGIRARHKRGDGVGSMDTEAPAASFTYSLQWRRVCLDLSPSGVPGPLGNQHPAVPLLGVVRMLL